MTSGDYMVVHNAPFHWNGWHVQLIESYGVPNEYRSWEVRLVVQPEFYNKPTQRFREDQLMSMDEAKLLQVLVEVTDDTSV